MPKEVFTTFSDQANSFLCWQTNRQLSLRLSTTQTFNTQQSLHRCDTTTAISTPMHFLCKIHSIKLEFKLIQLPLSFVQSSVNQPLNIESIHWINVHIYWSHDTITACTLAKCPIRDPNICQKIYTIYHLICLKCHNLYIGSTIRLHHIRIKERLNTCASSFYKHLIKCKNNDNNVTLHKYLSHNESLFYVHVTSGAIWHLTLHKISPSQDSYFGHRVLENNVGINLGLD